MHTKTIEPTSPAPAEHLKALVVSLCEEMRELGRREINDQGDQRDVTMCRESAESVKAQLLEALSSASADQVPVASLEAAREECDSYRAQLTVMREHAKGEVWYWQGDGEDHLESLVNSLPVVIRADQLRALVSAASQPHPQMGDTASPAHSDTKASELAEKLDQLANEGSCIHLQSWSYIHRLARDAAEVLRASEGRVQEIIEQIAKQWDGCAYDAPGESLDIGADIRSAATRLATADSRYSALLPDAVEICERIAIKHQADEGSYAAGKKAGALECAEALRLAGAHPPVPKAEPVHDTEHEQRWPNAVTPPPHEAEGAEIDPLQGAANWLSEAIESCQPSDIAGRLSIGYNRAKRLLDAATRRPAHDRH